MIASAETYTEPKLGEESQSSSPDTVSLEDGTVPDNACLTEVFSLWKRIIITFVVSWMALTVTFASTAIFSAADEIAKEYSTTVDILNVTNAGVLIAMGLSSFIWVPLSSLVGRKNSYNVAIFVLFVASIGAANAPNFRTFVTMRLLSGFTGTYFMVAGQTILVDIFVPTKRGLAIGFLMCGTLSGPALGPCLGGIIVTFCHWKIIYWVQVAMSGLGFFLSFIFIPSIRQVNEKARLPLNFMTIAEFSPWPTLKLLVYPNLSLVHLACGSLSWLQYSILTSPRHVINPRFNFTSPLVSSIFYLAPGGGFLVGSILGGKLSDYTVAKRIIRRNGLRLPQDRLNSGVWAFFILVPISTLIYGWGLQYKIGGLALPIVVAFFCGLGLMLAFNSLNTYCGEVIPEQRSQVIAGKYLVQYLFAAGGSAAVVPMIDAIGTGLTFTICTVLVIIGGICIILVARHGLSMQNWVKKRLQ